VINSPGTIDSDYRGEVIVLLVNHDEQGFSIKKGDRIAQLVIAPVPFVEIEEVEELEETVRGAGGFGSTGKGVEQQVLRKSMHWEGKGAVWKISEINRMARNNPCASYTFSECQISADEAFDKKLTNVTIIKCGFNAPQEEGDSKEC